MDLNIKMECKDCPYVIKRYGYCAGAKGYVAKPTGHLSFQIGNTHRTMKEVACGLSHGIEAGSRTKSFPPESGDTKNECSEKNEEVNK